MAPKTEKIKGSQEEKPALSNPINTDDWKCAVALLLERSPCDINLTQIFSEEAATDARKEVKSIDFERDVMKILKEYTTGETSYRFSFLLNFPEVFNDATQHLKVSNKIPVNVMANIIRAFILMLKKEDIERRTKLMECNNDPIEIMRAKPLVSVLAEKGNEKRRDSKGKNEKVKQPQKKTPEIGTSKATVKVKPPDVAKEDTRLLRRGEQVKEFYTIDDTPQDAFFKLYIVLTGFREPDLALEMLKSDIPLHGVFCLSASPCITSAPAMETNEIDIDEYWTQFLRMLWCREFTHYFSDVVFQLFTPSNLPSLETELRSFIYREISFLMYDLSDLKHQLTKYHRSMRLWNVDTIEENFEFDRSYVNELEQLHYDCINIPVIVQHILDLVCGEDYPQEEEEEEEEVPSQNGSVSISQASSSYSVSQTENFQSRVSFTSLIPLSSTVKLPTPRWSNIVDSDEKRILYNKLLVLDHEYGLEEHFDGGGLDMSTYKVNICAPKKQRLPCENLDMEIENYQNGLLSKLWRNYPIGQKKDFSHKLMRGINFPEFMFNYLLYILWISRLDTVSQEKEVNSITDVSIEQSRTKFTITDGSRIALHKAFRSTDFFSPSELKIITAETLMSASEPQLRLSPKFSWTEKSYVSDSHIPLKYIEGTPLGVFEDLRNFVGEELFSCMKDYDFIEELSKCDMVQKIEDSLPHYDYIRHAYSPLTDSIYVCMYNSPGTNIIRREVYNVMLRTPVGLRDFHDYVIDDEQEWMLEQKQKSEDTSPLNSCPISMYNPSPCFRDFTDYDFWHENSIKYSTRVNEVLESIIQKVDTGKTETYAKKEQSKQKVPSTVYAMAGESYRFVGFDFEPRAIQFSGVETIFKGPDSCYARVCLHERLYGKQQLGLHIQLGGHILHLYSFVCPRAHLDQPHTFHVEFKNGIIVAFSKRVFPKRTSTELKDNEGFATTMEEDNFAYDMKLSFPHDLTVETVRKHVNPCYIKQSYISKNNSGAYEKKRLFLPNGSVVKIMANDTVEVLNADTSIVTTSLEDLVLKHSESDNEDLHCQNINKSDWFLRSYVETMTNGCQYKVIDDEVVETKRFQIIKNTVMEAEEKYFHRMDSTRYVILGDGTICVEFPDGTKISTSLLEENLCLEDEIWYGEEIIGDMYIIVHMKIVMEHPEYATVVYNSRSSTWRILLPSKSEIEIDPSGCYHVYLDGQTELDVCKKMLRMWRYNARDEFVMSINADLTAFEKEQPGEYCSAIDSRGKKFVVETDGNCYVTENDDRSSESENQAEVGAELKKYFVVRRDLTGFEIIHTQTVTKEIEAIGPDVLTLCELTVIPEMRYFALLKKAKVSYDKWTVESVTPNTKFCAQKLKTSSTYGKPPSWMHPFPKKQPEGEIPELIEGRILLETKPTNCPNPATSTTDHTFCDTSQFPEPSMSLTDNVTTLMRRVADQDQEVLKEIFLAAQRQKAQSKTVIRSNNPKLEKYLDMSKYHVKFREYLKDSIRQKAIIGYFDHTRGMVWLIIQSIIENFAEDVGAPAVEALPTTQSTESSKESSEIEYDIDWSSDPSYSDLSFKSNLSMKTTPAENVPICSKFLPSPRQAKSEPIYKIEDVKKRCACSSNTYEYNIPLPPSEICVFTEEDMHVLEQTTLLKGKESEISSYQLEDLIKLGLI